MPAQTFAYKGRDAAGKVVKGRVDASSEGAVVAASARWACRPSRSRPQAAAPA